MSGAPDPVARRDDQHHYSYRHYADAKVAAGFDDLRFGGPIGQFLLESQQAVLLEALAPVRGRRVLDVGTGTGRAAIGLAQAGASVVGVDASAEMLEVAAARAKAAGVPVQFERGDAHALPVGDRTVDAAVSLRVLMHTVDWRTCLAELCRVARWRVVVDFPALASFAALESGTRRLAKALGRNVEAYRVMAESDVASAFAACGFRVVMIRRQFVLPIALHKAVGTLGFTRSVEGGLRRMGLLRLLGSPVTMVAER
ncbi:MAG TPA: methyltransferase domain-containing protein [Vicinamibacterales bacterium]|nr:methyltransferase domain-containing protein [Vicinamibacterales bacterium]